jgi:anti-sigma regulatory factor (Ser/Thr protein kinase)
MATAWFARLARGKDRGVSGEDQLSHAALLYRDQAEYLRAVAAFVDQGLDAGEAVMVALPREDLDEIASVVKRSQHNIHLTAIDDLGGNPRRIIPAIIEFVREHASGPARFVGSAVWPGRPHYELAEATRQDALLNAGLSGFQLKVLCPYEVVALPDTVVRDVWRTHPVVIADGQPQASSHYCDPVDLCANDGWPLESPPETLLFVAPVADLSKLKSLVYEAALNAELAVEAAEDLVMAVNEVATNSVLFAPGTGFLTMWNGNSGDLVCEVWDAGRMADPLAGCYPPGPDFDARGLWLVNQLCDLVEIRSGEQGTQVRMRVATGKRRRVNPGAW